MFSRKLFWIPILFVIFISMLVSVSLRNARNTNTPQTCGEFQSYFPTEVGSPEVHCLDYKDGTFLVAIKYDGSIDSSLSQFTVKYDHGLHFNEDKIPTTITCSVENGTILSKEDFEIVCGHAQFADSKYVFQGQQAACPAISDLTCIATEEKGFGSFSIVRDTTGEYLLYDNQANIVTDRLYIARADLAEAFLTTTQDSRGNPYVNMVTFTWGDGTHETISFQRRNNSFYVVHFKYK